MHTTIMASLLEQIVTELSRFIVATIARFGYAGILITMAIESACIPLPSEIIMPFSGYLVSTGRFDLWLVATAGAVGCNLGSIVGYEVGKRGGRAFVARWGKYVLLNMDHLAQAERFFDRWGSI